MADEPKILDPSEASSGTKFKLAVIAMAFITVGAIGAAFHEGFRMVYENFGELLLGSIGLYYGANVTHKWVAGSVNGKYGNRRKRYRFAPPEDTEDEPLLDEYGEEVEIPRSSRYRSTP